MLTVGELIEYLCDQDPNMKIYLHEINDHESVIHELDIDDVEPAIIAESKFVYSTAETSLTINMKTKNYD